MDKDNIITIDLTTDMIAEARKDAEFLRSKMSWRTINLKDNRDIIGSLAHQAVEQAFENTEMYFESTRKLKYLHGDEYDIKYENDTIDIKGTAGTLDKWFYNKSFLVITKQLEKEKIEKISHFCFVVVEPDYTQAYIFGLMERHNFVNKSTNVSLKFENKMIRARELKPFRDYVYHVSSVDLRTPRAYF
jgi:hypothetical protein